MKSINKKLYTVIAVCLLTLSLTVFAMAENGTSSLPAVTETSTPTTTSDVVLGTESEVVSGDENVSGTDSGLVSGDVSDSSATGSDVSGSLEASGSSELTSGDNSDVSVSGTSSTASATTNNTTSYKRPSGYGNVGGTVSDGIDTSGWGTVDDETSVLASTGTTEKTESKEITNYSNLLWVLIWIPILLIIGSIAALVYVNRKEFLNGDTGAVSSKPISDKAKRKNNHKNRTNVYKPRD